MDKKLARKNMRTGISMFIMLLALLGVTFVWASVYLNAVK
jgi:hypothetical protein